MVLVALGLLARLKEERGNPMGTRGDVTRSSAIAVQHLPVYLITFAWQTDK